MYREDSLEHFKHPHKRGRLEDFDAETRKANPNCGDVLDMTVKLSGDRKHIDDARFDGEGCAISVATTSMIMADIAKYTTEEWLHLSDDDFLKEMGLEDVTGARRNCALLSLHTLQDALSKRA